VARLLGACPSLRVLAVSRMALGLRGEQVWRVPPLDVEHAAQLFADRVRLTSPGPSVEGPGHEHVVERICERLDGLPLAIELAAASTRVLSPQETLGRLERALPLPQSRSRDVDPRQETMEATIDWSYQLLAPGEQRLFDLLSVFAGGFDLAAAQAVVPGGDVLGDLATLVDHSLVLTGRCATGAATRYRILEPLRQYAAARLVERGEHDATRRCHAQHYLAVARRLDGELRTSRVRAVLRQLAEDDGNFHAAFELARSERADLGLRLCTALATSWALRGRVNDGRALMEEMLQAETSDRRLRAGALYRASRLAWRQLDYPATRALLVESLAIEQELGDLPRAARRLRSLAVVAMTEGDLDEAERLLGECIAILRVHGDSEGLGLALAFLALTRQLAGENEQAVPYVQEALELSRASGNIPGAVYSLSSAIFGAITSGDASSLRVHAVAAADLLRTMGGFDEDPGWLWAAIALASAEGRYRSALRLAGAVEAVARRDGLRFHEQFQQHVRPWLERARKHVSTTELTRLSVQGAQLTLDELIEEALGLSDTAGDSPLSPREAEVAELIARGLTNAEIAEHLVISKRTVESHVAHVKTKLGLARRIEVATWVLEGRHPNDAAT
jgi:predicted ATPase/DNA-binding CsgD family transcriptional regulator